MLTPPVDVITTTIAMCGCSSSTSTWRTVAAWSGGADTSASSRVSSESASVVACSVASTSPAFTERSSGKLSGRPSRSISPSTYSR